MVRLISVLCFIVVLLFTRPALSDEWNPILTRDFVTQEGSPLDFDSIFGSKASVPKFEAITVSKDGRLSFSSGVPANFNCSVLAWSRATGGMPSHNDAEIYAKQLKRYGYNIVRFHYLDAHFMTGRTQDFDFDPVQLDRWYFLLAKLKENGIRWVFDGMTSPNGALGGMLPHPWVKKSHDLKLGVYFDRADQDHWRELIAKLYGKVNPYTGMAPLRDPALFGIILVNENSLDFYSPHSLGWPSAGLNESFSVWLKKKYGSTDRLEAKWRDLSFRETIEDHSVSLPRDLSSSGPRSQDVISFVQDLQIETAAWMTAYLRSLGFQGRITGYDESMKLASAKSRSSFEWVDMHTYHDHVGDPLPGARIEQESSMASSLRYVRDAAFTRLYGRAFTLTEYGQPFWNRYRYEAGPIVSAYANLQNWDMVCLYSFGSLDLRYDPEGALKKRVIQPYVGGIDPVVRASETVASYVMLARPFRQSGNVIAVPFDRDNLPSQVSNSYLTKPTTALSLLSRGGLADKDYLAGNAGVIRLNDPDLSRSNGLSRISGKLNEKTALLSRVEDLRRRDVLKKGNLTSTQNEVFHSDTEQIYLDVKGEVFKAVSPKAEILVANKNLGRNELGVFSINRLSTNGMVSFLALDQKSLRDSGRILVVVVSDARNTEMEFSDDERVIKSLGKSPLLLRRISVDVEGSFKPGLDIQVRSLKLNGDLGEKIKVGREGGKVKFNLDTSGYSHGPTTYFLLSRE